MYRSTLLVFAFLLPAATLAAQSVTYPMTQGRNFARLETVQPNGNQTQTVVIPSPPQAILCPVSFRAQQSGVGNMMEVDHSRPKGIAQRLHLTLTNQKSIRVASATVIARGLTPQTRATLAPLTVGGDPSNAAKTLDIAFPGGLDKAGSMDLWVPGFSAVYSVDLISLNYADGSTWKVDAGLTCRAQIDPILFISGR
jgi:hypothetical protein